MMNTEDALIFTYSHLPEGLMFLANPPKDVTLDKYNDIFYIERVYEMVEELDEKYFNILRKDGVCPYDKKVILKHITNRLIELRGKKK